MRGAILTAVILTATACGGGSHNFECTDNASCNLSGGGTCIAAPSGKSWCAYPDPGCSSGFRYSEQDAGDGLGGTCVPGNIYTLSVSIGGNATGAVTSDPAGIDCSSGTCTANFKEGTVVDLSAMVTSGAFLGWSGACSGQGACTVTMDGDLSVGAQFGIPGQALWAKQFGSAGDQTGEFGEGIAIDGNGDLIVVGEFENTMTAKAGTDLVSAGGLDIFVIKMSSTSGDVVWAKRFGGPSTDRAADVAVDASNNIYIVGDFGGTVDFGGGNVTTTGTNGLSDVFTLKLDPAGNYGWLRKVGGPDGDTGYAITVKGTKVVTTGTFYTSVTVDSMTFNAASAGYSDLFVHSMSTANGATDWFKPFGGSLPDWGSEIEIDGSGSVLVTGRFGGTVNFGGQPMTAGGVSDAFVLKLAGANGAHQVSFRIGGSGIDLGYALTVDASNNIFAVGDFNGTADFGCPSTVTASQTNRNDLYLAKYSQAGSCQWVKGFGGTGGSADYGPHAYGIAINATGDIAIGGAFCGSINFGGSPLNSASPCNETDVFAARYMADGTHLTSVRAGGSGEESALSVAQAPDGRVFVTGGFRGFAEFGGQTLTAEGLTDIFVLALAPL